MSSLQCKISNSAQYYEIEIGRGGLSAQASFLKTIASKFVVITDDIIALLYGQQLVTSLQASGLETFLFSFPHGEQNKTRETKQHLEDRMFEKGLGRDTCVIALGGGVVTDLAGFIAATFCRGIAYIMVPTSLLGMVDSCIGGKTGVNIPFGKNMLGCIYQPKKVVIDLNMLDTLPKDELINGYVEVIKHSLIGDSRLFEDLEKHVEFYLKLDSPYIGRVIYESCSIKKQIVEEDVHERGKRYLLNFGHTVGHALERLSNYTLPHGEAVAIGLIVESYISMKLGILEQHSFERIRRIFVSYGLPLKLPSALSVSDICETMVLDKKSIKGKPRFVLITDIGIPLVNEGNYCFNVDDDDIKNALQWMIDDLCCH